jgi:hypothetical protein
MDTIDFINIIRPEHDRTSCNDDEVENGFGTRYGDGKRWEGRCTRCMYLQIINGADIPEGFVPDECFG